MVAYYVCMKKIRFNTQLTVKNGRILSTKDFVDPALHDAFEERGKDAKVLMNAWVRRQCDGNPLINNAKITVATTLTEGGRGMNIDFKVTSVNSDGQGN